MLFRSPEYGRGAALEMAVFVGVLALGLLYAWRKRILRWV